MDEKRLRKLSGLNEALGPKERTTKGVLKGMLSGDFKNLQEAYFKAREGTMEYPAQLERIFMFQSLDKNSEAYKTIKAEIKIAKAALKAFDKTKMGRLF